MRIQRQRRDERERLSGSKARRTGRSMLTTPARRPSCRRSAPSLVGRWLSRDPVNEQGGRNLYALVGNTVIGFVDDLGRWALHTDIAIDSAPDGSEPSDLFKSTTPTKPLPPPGIPKHPGGGQCPNNLPGANGCGPGAWKFKIVPDHKHPATSSTASTGYENPTFRLEM